MNKKLSVLLLSGLLLLTAVGCDQQQETPPEQPAQKEEVVVEKPEPVVLDTYTVNVVKETMTVKVLGDDLDLEIAYPVLGEVEPSPLVDRINATMLQHFKSIQQLLAGEANVVDAKVEISKQNKNFLSFAYRFTTDPSANGTDLYHLVKGVTLDMQNGAPVDLRTFMMDAKNDPALWALLEEKATAAIATMEKEVVNPFTASMVPEAWMNDQGLVVSYMDQDMVELTLAFSEEELIQYFHVDIDQ